ncbi:MAG: hypothetical protein FWD27_04660 [Coriobacteriia bacterium]|nr:hypothetical protein [Coriobacteriia bacterium]
MNVVQQVFEVTTVGRLGTCTAVNKLFDYASAKRKGLAFISFALGRYGKALVITAASLALSACGYPQIRYRAL